MCAAIAVLTQRHAVGRAVLQTVPPLSLLLTVHLCFIVSVGAGMPFLYVCGYVYMCGYMYVLMCMCLYVVTDSFLLFLFLSQANFFLYFLDLLLQMIPTGFALTHKTLNKIISVNHSGI